MGVGGGEGMMGGITWNRFESLITAQRISRCAVLSLSKCVLSYFVFDGAYAESVDKLHHLPGGEGHCNTPKDAACD